MNRSPGEVLPTVRASELTRHRLQQAVREHPDRDLVLLVAGECSAACTGRLVDRCRLHHPSNGAEFVGLGSIGGVEVWADGRHIDLCPHEELVVDLLRVDTDLPVFLVRPESDDEWAARLRHLVDAVDPHPWSPAGR